MAKQNGQKRAVSIHEIPPEVIGGLVISELAQIRTDAETHQDPDARRRIITSANMLQEIAQNEIGPETFAEIRKLEEISLRLQGKA